jgi:hypothetical protein
MKIILIILLVIGLILALFRQLVISGEKNRKQQEEDRKLITVENYELIRDSPYADELSRHTIRREEGKLVFSSENGYLLFWLEIKKDEPNGIKLRGLDGYGIRDREFLKYTATLIRKITHTQ